MNPAPPVPARQVRGSLTSTLERAPKVLVVDDDLLTLRLLEIILVQAGCEVYSLADPLQVREKFEKGEIGPFDCATIDYSMPGCNGIELMRALNAVDPCMGAILLTAVDERHLVRDSFREGAVDFIAKPVRNQELLETIRKALERTRARRKRLETQLSLKDASRASHVFRNFGVPELESRLATAYVPRDEIGGDFLDVFRRANDDIVCVLGDVAGHDLRSALLSAFFSGFLEGLIRQEADVHAILRAFNHRLNLATPTEGILGAPDSVAAGVMTLDASEQSVEIITCGFPPPMVTFADGRIEEPETANAPLGWFSDAEIEGTRISLDGASCLLAFTDGLQDFAAERNIEIGAVAYQILAHEQNPELLAEIVRDSSDDILATRLQLQSAEKAGHRVHPLMKLTLPGTDESRIDEIESTIQRSLELAFGSFQRLPEVSLCCRETILNALRHGCAGDSGRFATVEVTFCEVQSRLRVRIEDDGPGHDFDLEARKEHLETCDEHFDDPGRHLGLVLLERTSDYCELQRKGATVIFDFFLGQDELNPFPGAIDPRG